jgi:hypothetical protein
MSSNTMISLRPANVIRRLPWQLDSKAALGFLLILGTFSLVGWLYLTQASAVTATSYRIDELRLELDHLKNQNATLGLQIAQLEALPRVEQRARELGFQPTNDVRYLAVPNYPLASAEEDFTNNISYSREPLEVFPSKPVSSAWWVDLLDNFAAWLEGQTVVVKDKG